MRPIGFSTGALAKGDFNRGIEILRRCHTKIVELSALRQHELLPLMSAIDHLDLTSFSYISIHAPSRIAPGTEKAPMATSKSPTCGQVKIPRATVAE